MTPTQADPRYEVLASLVSEAAADSPFYRGLYRAAGIPTGRLSGEDARHLLVRLPVVGGEDLLARADEFRPETARPFRVTCSGGTVGRPKVLYRTAQDWAASTANVAELFRRAGVTGGEALLILQPLHTWGIGGLALDCCRLLGCTAVPVDPGEDPEGIAFFVRRFNAGAVFATPSLWRTFTEWAGGHGLRGPLRLLLAGERLSPEDRRHFAAYWGGGVSDLYGSEETDGLGVACPEAGGFHLLDHSFLFQVEVDGRCTPPDGPGEYTGDLVVTSLYHRGTPLIKYRLGDTVTLTRAEHPCRCGSRGTTVRVLGRRGLCAALHDATKVYTYQLDAALRAAVGRTPAYQVVIEGSEGPERRDCLTVLLPRAELGPADVDRITASVQNSSVELAHGVRAGRVSVRVVGVDSFLGPTRKGKFQTIVDRRARPQ